MLRIQSFTFSPVQENTYVLYNEDKHCCIIDPGCYFQDEKESLKNFVDGNDLIPLYLLNTHCHLDHVFGNKFVGDTWNLPLYIHEKERPVLAFAPETGRMWQLPFDNFDGEVRLLREGDRITMDGDSLEVLFAPGHSPGHVCFYCEEQEFVMGGDVLFSGSIGRTDLPGGNFDTLFNSIQTRLFVLPDDTKVYPGHGPVTTIGFEKMNNPFVKLY